MDLASLEVFQVVAREQSVTRAAEVLRRAPSNVTTRIQQLEQEIGTQLFQRETKRMLLTGEGMTFLGYVDRILNLSEEARQVLSTGEPSGTLRIGSMEATAATRLPGPLATFSARWPSVIIDLSTNPTRQLIDAVLAHQIDCALVAMPKDAGSVPDGGLDMLPVFNEELLLLLPPGHSPIEGPQDVKPKALAAFAHGCTYRMIAEDWGSGLAGRPAGFRIQEVRSYHAMAACTAAGSCYSVMPRSVLDMMPDASHFTLKRLTDVETRLVSRAGYRTPAFDAFREVLLKTTNIGGPQNGEG